MSFCLAGAPIITPRSKYERLPETHSCLLACACVLANECPSKQVTSYGRALKPTHPHVHGQREGDADDVDDNAQDEHCKAHFEGSRKELPYER